ncbi:hypothetical protein [Hydrocoleum sp. CS-953]|nr:hypothetical protein [Hydrocoleum sp. CS-953]
MLLNVIYKVRNSDKFCLLWKYYCEILNCISSGEIQLLVVGAIEYRM